MHDELECKVLVEPRDGRVLERGLEQRVQQVEPGLVGGEPGARLAHAAEPADVDVAVVRPAPRAAPAFELVHLLRSVLHEVLHDVLVAQPVAARDGVREVLVDRVARTDDPGGPALGRNRVRAHRVDLRDEHDAQLGVRDRGRDRGTQPGPTSADDGDIGPQRLHHLSCGRAVGATVIASTSSAASSRAVVSSPRST